ncbi:hypothetical protein [Hydrogenophaga pseudoflava]|nr:hypothetical protein [Hydrogenophaga pseudoflava]
MPLTLTGFDRAAKVRGPGVFEGEGLKLIGSPRGTVMQALEIELTKLALASFLIQLGFVIAFFFTLYFVIKNAIRDGINESRLAERRWNEGVADPAIRDALRETKEAAKVLPPMRAD